MALVQLVNDQRVGIDMLATYQVGPGTVIYLGYTTAYQNVAPSTAGLPVERTASPGAQVGRQLFVKASFLVRR